MSGWIQASASRSQAEVSRRRAARRAAQRARVGEHAAVDVEHPDRATQARPSPRISSLISGDGTSTVPSCVARRGAAGRAELADERARLRVVHVHHRERQPRADQRARQAQLDQEAGRRRAPHPDDPVVRHAAAVLEHEPGRDRPVAARVDREAQELVVRRHHRDLDVVARAELGPLGIAQHDVLVVHLEERVDAGAVPADPVAVREGRLAGDRGRRLEVRLAARLRPSPRRARRRRSASPGSATRRSRSKLAGTEYTSPASSTFGRSLSAVATARAVETRPCSCTRSSRRSSSRTYS